MAMVTSNAVNNINPDVPWEGGTGDAILAKDINDFTTHKSTEKNPMFTSAIQDEAKGDSATKSVVDSIPKPYDQASEQTDETTEPALTKIFVPLPLKRNIVIHLEMLCVCIPFVDARGRHLYKARKRTSDPISKGVMKIYPQLTSDSGLRMKITFSESQAALKWGKSNEGSLHIREGSQSVVCVGSVTQDPNIITLKLIIPKDNGRNNIVGNMYKKCLDNDNVIMWKVIVHPNLR
ncbi:unnamed protein product [Owenia fusiformis]|uniref:Uncharacterized protein n=1 Tax=Owenia fusiformis TaxID=6347 RepID=A0A8S4NMM9_OWEFU|nr:unnamed protein product [Owenia fusiformis]